MEQIAYEEHLAAMLGEKRLRHSYCVRDRAAALADIHGADREKAALAGLLHDICHDIAKEEQLKYLRRRGILLDTLTLRHPVLWHAPCGAAWLREELGVADEEVLDAVRYHTTGRKDMSLLDKVVFLADATSAERDYPSVEERRLLADKDLDTAMLAFLRFELERQAKAGGVIVRDAWEAYNDFARKQKSAF